MRHSRIFLLLSFLFLIFVISFTQLSKTFHKNNIPNPPTPSSTPPPEPTNTPTTIPTPKPLTFNELNNLYGPCTSLPVLTYHHIEDIEIAKKNNRSGIAVSPQTFENQLIYLNSKGYNSQFTYTLTNFFNQNTPIPNKSVILTFDDGYEDFYTQAFPLLKKYNTKAVLYLPTGLVDNPEYLTWNQISELNSSGLIEISNHTWSHRSAKSTPTAVRDEITIADTQLKNHNLNQHLSFAYPYGDSSEAAQKILIELNYQTAFTTRYGKVHCLKQRLSLPRIRIGNSPLSQFGL